MGGAVIAALVLLVLHLYATRAADRARLRVLSRRCDRLDRALIEAVPSNPDLRCLGYALADVVCDRVFTFDDMEGRRAVHAKIARVCYAGLLAGYGREERALQSLDCFIRAKQRRKV